MVAFCKTRKERNTLYAFGEGATESAFLRYLKSIYSRNQNIKIKVKDLGGKDPGIMVDKAIRNLSQGEYDKKFLLVDIEDEKGIIISQSEKDKANEADLDIIDIKPCVEALFLLILGKSQPAIDNMSSGECKKEFEENHLNAQKKLSYGEYENIMPKNLLEEKRKTIAKLDKIISYMENKQN